MFQVSFDRLDTPLFGKKQFKETFHVNWSTFKYLVDNLRPLIGGVSTICELSLEQRIGIVLYTLASGDRYRIVARKFGINRKTLSGLIAEICTAIWDKFQSECFTAYPPTQTKIEETVAEFEQLGFPQCYGIIDGFHIPVFPTKEDGNDFLNYKNWNSMVLLGTVDYSNRFSYICVGACGSVSDQELYGSTTLKVTHETNELFQQNARLINRVSVPVILIGDLAFKPCKEIIRPFMKKELSPEEKIFNEQHFTMRVIKEDTFRMLRGRFWKLTTGLEMKDGNHKIMVKVASLLHNMCINRGDEVKRHWLNKVKALDQSYDLQQPHHRRLEKPSKEPNEATQIREALMKNFGITLLILMALCSETNVYFLLVQEVYETDEAISKSNWPLRVRQNLF